MSVLRKWMGLRFGSFYRCIIPPLSTTSGLATRRCGPRAFLLSSSPLSLSLFFQAVIRSRGNTEKLRHAPRQVPIDIESLLLSLEIKGARSLSLSFFLSFVDNWKGYYREQMEVENRRYSRKFTPRETV